MPTYRNDIEWLVEQAAANYLRAEGLNDILAEQIQPGQSAVPIRTPFVACICQGAEADVPFEGNWKAVLRIEVHSNADDTTEAAHHLRNGQVRSKFFGEPREIGAAVSANQDDFTAMFILPLRAGTELVDRSWVSFLELQVHCNGSDIDMT